MLNFLIIYPITSDKINEHWLNIIIAGATIVSLVCVYLELRKNVIRKKTKIAIFEDLIRHFWINNVITEVVIEKLKKDKDAIPEEGIFKRMAVLDTDLNFNESQLVRKPSSFAHQCELKMRNYNVSAESTYRAICDDQVSLETKLTMLDDLLFRSNGIIERIYEVALDEKIKMRPKEDIIATQYSEDKSKISLRAKELTKDTEELNRIFQEQKQRKINNDTVQFIK